MKSKSIKKRYNCERTLAFVSYFTKILLVIFICNIYVISQDVKNTDYKADKGLKSSSRVNPTTLAMEFSLSLANYPGRSGNSLPVGITYSSKLWRVQHDYAWWSSTPLGALVYHTNTSPTFAERSASGWTSSLRPPHIVEKIELYDQFGDPNSFLLSFDQVTQLSSNQGENLMQWCTRYCVDGFTIDGTFLCTAYTPWSCTTIGGCSSEASCGGGGWGNNGGNQVPPPPPPPFYVKRVRVEMPDGSTHEFRKDDKSYPYCANANETSRCNGESGIDDTGMFLAVDGSGMRLERGVSFEGATKSILHLPNGSKYIFVAAASEYTEDAFYYTAEKFIDVNGNQTAYDSQTNTWTDTFGRSIKDFLPENWIGQAQEVKSQDVQMPGFGSTGTQDYVLEWERLEDVFDLDLIGTERVLNYTGKNKCIDPVYTSISPALFDQNAGNSRICTNRDNNGDPALFNPIVLSEVQLPNGRKFVFKYNRFAEITKIVSPTGAIETFDYITVPLLGSSASVTYAQANRGVKEHSIYNSAGILEQKTKYEVTSSVGSTYDIKVTSSKSDDASTWGAYTIKSRHLLISNDKFGFNNPLSGRIKETRSYDEVGQLRSRNLTDWIYEGPTSGGEQNAMRDIRASSSVSFTFEPGEAYALATYSKSFYDDAGSTYPEFFSHLNVKKSEGYEYAAIPVGTAETMALSSVEGWFPSGKLASVTETDYDYNNDYKENGILGLTTETRVLNPQNTSEVLAKTQSVYDEYSLLPRAATTGYVAPTGTHSGLRANLTTQKLWDDDNNIWLESHTEYDVYGNAFKTIDHQGRFATVEFDDANKFAYPIRTISPAPGNGTTGTTEEFKTETKYDFMTGLVTEVTDLRGENNSADDLKTTTEYNDALLRPTAVVAPNGARTETEYYDDPNPATNPEGLRVVTRSQFDTNVWNEAIAYADSLGRAYKTRTIDSNGDVIVETKFDNAGRPIEVSNPYREGTLPANILWSKTEYDAGGRVENVYSPVTDPDTNPGDSIGTTAYGIMNSQDTTGVWTISTDASGRKKRSVTNSKGQLVRVDEASSDKTLDPIPQGTPNPTPTPNPSPTPPDEPPSCYGGTASCLNNNGDFPSVSTYYRYSIKGEMVEVTQGDQKRNFLYDSLGRLIRVKQPEQEVNTAFNKTDPITGNNEWTARMQYDVMGKVIESEDAKGTKINYTYDSGDRVLTMTYSDGTPQVTYKYDLIPNGKGALIETSNVFSTSKTTQINQWGRPTEYQQITNVGNQANPDLQTYTSKYTYNLSGALVQEEYPSGRVVKNSFDDNGDVGRVYGKATSSSVEKTYANSFNYMASGGILAMKLGNGKWETVKYNNRLQVTELGLGNASQDAGLLKINYDFGEIDASGNIDATMNTGNIARQTISFNGLSQPFVQSYKYDSLYRLTEAKEEISGQTNPNWSQNFTYDRYGNRQTHDKEINGNLVAENSQTHPTIDTNTNRFDSGQGYSYDKVGNLIVDGDGRTFTFDGNNKQTFVSDGNKTIGVYFYDGNGMRVKKERYSDGNPAETVIFVYSGGKLVEEFSNQPPTSPKTKYLTEDHLGTPRIITDGDGEVVSRRDFLPFGEDITSTVGTRSTSGFKYATTEDDVRQKFTGYQKDEETGLDFAEARMYENRHARFTAVDPLLASGKSANPQTFNRFVYVGNNPINITDPLGLDWYFNGDKNHYKWFDDKADDGYTAVDFGDGNKFEYQGCFTSDCSGTAQAYLMKSGGWNWNTQSLINNLSVYNDLNNINISLPNYLKSGVPKGGRNFLRGVGNSPWTTNFFGVPADSPEIGLSPSIPLGVSLEKLGIKPPFERENYDNSVEAAAGYGTEGVLGVTSFFATKRVTSPARNINLSGGQSFSAYKKSRGGTETLAQIPTTGANGRPTLQRISTEFHHVFFKQRHQRTYNLPNWLVNNRANVWKVNTIQHSLIDKHRFRFLKHGLKPKTGFFKEYNWFTNFDGK